MRVLILLAVCIAAISAAPNNPQKIVGGTLTTIDKFPDMVALLYTTNFVVFSQSCAGSILNTRFVLTAAHCIYQTSVGRWRIRAGSTFANSGGDVYDIDSHIIHENFVRPVLNSDIAIIRTSTPLVYSSLVRAAFIAGTNYNLNDNEEVTAIGWGVTENGGFWKSEQLREVQLLTVNQQECARRYGSQGMSITVNMLCTGWLGVGGRDQCDGDSGGPLYHHGTVVGVCSFGPICASHFLPGVNVRVTRFTEWIQHNAVLRQ